MTKVTIACVLRTPNNNGLPELKRKYYGPDDVLKLKKGFERNISFDHEFVCLSDQLIEGVHVIPLIGNTQSWWSKIELFRPNLFQTPVFYCDLDMVICNPLDDMFDAIKNEKFLMLNHGSGIMYWQPNNYSYLWEEYCESPKKAWKTYSKKPNIGDQAYIYDRLPIKKSFFDVEGFDRNWLYHISEKYNDPHPDAKILICVGYSNKLHKSFFQNHKLIKEHWRL